MEEKTSGEAWYDLVLDRQSHCFRFEYGDKDPLEKSNESLVDDLESLYSSLYKLNKT